MQITKYEHACLDIREGNSRIVIDPGVFTKSLDDFAAIDVLVITHIHPDHFDPEKVTNIVASNPSIRIFTTEQVAAQISSPSVQVPQRNLAYTVKDLLFEFYGEQHATIRPDLPITQNIGIRINGKLYYPGDSFTECPVDYEILATPVMAPWLKFSETADLVAKSPAQKIFPTHNGFLNDDGHALYQRMLTQVCEPINKQFIFIAPGEKLEA